MTLKNMPILLSMIMMLFIVSCKKNSNETVEAVVHPDNPSKMSEMIVNSDVVSKTSQAVINTDCDSYDRRGGVHIGKFKKGDSIIILDYFSGQTHEDEFDIKIDIMVEVRTIDGAFSGLVFEQFITYLDDERYDFWFKNVLLTREYYYTGTVETVWNNDYGRNVRQDIAERIRVLWLWRAFYSEWRLRISDNYIILGNNEGAVAYRLESVIKDGSMYTIQLSQYPWGEFEITLVDDGDGVTITQYVVRKELLDDIIQFSLNFRYVPYDSEKSEKMKNAVITWCKEQIEILTQSVN